MSVNLTRTCPRGSNRRPYPRAVNINAEYPRVVRLVVAALLVCIGGCGTGPASTKAPHTVGSVAASRSAGPVADVAPQLAAALHAVDGQGLRLGLTARGGDLECDHQASNQGFSCSGDTRDGALDMVAIGNDLYLRIPKTGARFLHYSVAKLPNRLDLLILLDPLFGRHLLEGATGVRPGKAGQPSTFQGTLDLTKATVTGTDRRIVDVLAGQAGAQAGAVPYTVTVDAQGRLAGIQATFPAANPADQFVYRLKVTDVDPNVTVVPPARDRWSEAPASAYK
jgi:hypothetical protein